MLRNVFLPNNTLTMINQDYKPISEGHMHNCPNCRCKSIDSSAVIKIQPRPKCNFNILLGKDFLNKKTKYSKNNEPFQNVYYRSFQSPIKIGLSPNGSKKIVIQYSSPQHYVSSSRLLNPLLRTVSSTNLKTSIILSSHEKLSPRKTARNIYTNQNTPPKAKFLQKRSSRKNSEDRGNFSTQFQGFALVQSQKISCPIVLNGPLFKNQNQFYEQNQKKLQQKYRQNDISPVRKAKDIIQANPQQSKNLVARNSSPRNFSSPFNSLGQMTPQVVPYGNFSSSIINDSSSKKSARTNKYVNQFNSIYNQPNFSKKQQNKIISQREYQSCKQIESLQHQQRYSYERFDKTQGKVRANQRPNDYQLSYSASDKRTLSNRIPYEIIPYENYVQQNAAKAQINTKSQQIIYQNTGANMFDKKKTNFDTVQLSDNFSTPKSKYKGIRGIQLRNNIQAAQNIRLNLQQNNSSSISPMTVDDGQRNSKTLSKVEHNPCANGLSSSSLGAMSKIKGNQDQPMQNCAKYDNTDRHNYAQQRSQQRDKDSSQMIQIKPNPKKSQAQIAAELQQQLKLNYDYYEYQIKQDTKPVPDQYYRYETGIARTKAASNPSSMYDSPPLHTGNTNLYKDRNNDCLLNKENDRRIRPFITNREDYQNSSIQEESENKSIDITF